LTPHREVRFVEDNQDVFLGKFCDQKPEKRRFRRLRGIATVKMITEEIMGLARQNA
jgi:hypothetical protein